MMFEKQALSPETIHRYVQAAAKRGFKKNLPAELINKLKEKGVIDGGWLEKADQHKRYISGLKLIEKSLGKQEAIKILNHPNYRKATPLADNRILGIVNNDANTVRFIPGGKDGKTGEKIGWDRLYGVDENNIFRYARKYQDIYRAGKKPVSELKNYLKVPEEFNTLNTIRQTTAAGGLIKLKNNIDQGKIKTTRRLVDAITAPQLNNVPHGKLGFKVITDFFRNKADEAKKAVVGNALPDDTLKNVKLPSINAPAVPGSDPNVIAEVSKDNASYWQKGNKGPLANVIGITESKQNPYTLAHELGHWFSDQTGYWNKRRYNYDKLPEEFFASMKGRSILRRLANATGLKTLPHIQNGTFYGLSSYIRDDDDFMKYLHNTANLPDNALSQVYKNGNNKDALYQLIGKSKDNLNAYLHERFGLGTKHKFDWIGKYLNNTPDTIFT